MFPDPILCRQKLESVLLFAMEMALGRIVRGPEKSSQRLIRTQVAMKWCAFIKDVLQGCHSLCTMLSKRILAFL